MNLGLEALPLPPGVAPPMPMGSPSLRPTSNHDPNKTFDDILGTTAPDNGKPKKKKK
jgi:hypothetical protein